MAYGNAGRQLRRRRADGRGQLGPAHPPGLESLCSFWVAPQGFVLDLLVLPPTSLGGFWVPPWMLLLFLPVLHPSASFEQPRSSSLLGSSGLLHPSRLWGVPWALEGGVWW